MHYAFPMYLDQKLLGKKSLEVGGVKVSSKSPMQKKQ